MRHDDNNRRQGYGLDFDRGYERRGRDSENWGANRGQSGGYEGRGSDDYGGRGYQGSWEGRGRQQGYDRDYDPGLGSSGYGGYGGGYSSSSRYQGDRARYGRQQESASYGDGQQGGYRDRFTDDYGTRQQGEQYGRGEDRYSEGFYGDASRFGSGMQQGGRGSQGHHDPDYQQWRTEQLRNLDNDYEAWRGERYKKFSDEFNTWRSNRTPSQSGNQSTQQASPANKGKDQS